jgi:uncharacterized protein with GYD domain
MQTYVTLWKYTKDGLMDIKKTNKRFELAKKVVKDAGGKLLSVYGLIGEYDLITVMEMPNEKVAAATILKICSTGRVTSKTMTALSLEDFVTITTKV